MKSDSGKCYKIYTKGHLAFICSYNSAYNFSMHIGENDPKNHYCLFLIYFNNIYLSNN